jgi:hypothetical protein
MEQGITRSDRVLMICTDRYVEKSNAGEGGVGYEKMIVTAPILRRIDSKKVIPIIRNDGGRVPSFLGSKLYIDLASEDRFETGMDQLLREILGAPLFKKPPIGNSPYQVVAGTARPTLRDPVRQLLLAVGSVYERSNLIGSVPARDVRGAMGSTKLHFDYACDLAIQQKLISMSVTHSDIYIETRGRELLMKLLAEGDGGT